METKRVFFILVLLAVSQSSFGQIQNERMTKSITVYALPKHSKYNFRVSQDRIKNLHEVKKTLITDDRKVLDYIISESFVGKVKPDFKEIDIRLLIEVIDTDGKVKSLSVSSTDLLQIDSKICEMLDYKDFIKRIRKYLPSKSGW